MKNRLTWENLAAMLPALNASWLEDSADLRKGRIHDVKRGKSNLTEDELARIREVLRSVFVQ
jgi:hypothetical protein